MAAFFYRTNDASVSLLGAVHAVLPDCEIYIREGEEFVFYMRQPWEETAEKTAVFDPAVFAAILLVYDTLDKDVWSRWI